MDNMPWSSLQTRSLLKHYRSVLGASGKRWMFSDSGQIQVVADYFYW